jgi:hypothetical protein
MSHLRDIINEERDNITDDIRDAVDNITPKYVLRITSHINYPGTRETASIFDKTVAFDTMSAVEEFISRELEKLEQSIQFSAYYSNARACDYETSVYASCRHVDCIITPPQRIRFLTSHCAFTPAAWEGKYAWFADEDFDDSDVALDTPEREIFKLGETTTDTGWRTQREGRRKARIEHENRNK